MTSRAEKNKKQSESIIKEEKRKKNKKRNSIIIKILISFIVITSSTYLYMRHIATSGIIVKEYSLTYDNLPIEFDGLKVIQLSDIAYGSTIYTKELKTIVKKINSIKPDIIIFTGGLIDPDYPISKGEKESLITILNSLEASIGKYSILSSKDKSNTHDIINNTDFHILENSYELIYYKGMNPIILIGIKNSQDIDKAYSYYQEKNSNKEIFNITITSNKELVKPIIKPIYRQNIIMTNDNGSLIKIPFANNYKDRYLQNNTDVFVSSGIGTDKTKVRLFNRPSINFYRLNSNEQKEN